MFFNRNANSNRIKTPTVLQMEATECGAASLTMVLSYYGWWLPLEKVREACGVNRDGVSAGNIVKAARMFNCSASGFRWNADKLRDAEPPLVIHWEFAHFVVFEGICGDTVYLNDPAMGHRKVDFAKFKESYTGIALQIRPDENFKKEGQAFSTVKALKEKLLKDKVAVGFVLFSSLCLVVPNLAFPAITQTFIDDVLSGKHPDWMFNMGLLLAGMLFLVFALNLLRLWVLTRWHAKLNLAGSAQFFWHVLRLPMLFFEQRSANEVANRVGFNNEIALVISGQAATALLDLFMTVFYLFLLAQYNLRLTVIGVLITGINAGIFFYVRGILKEMVMQAQQEAGKEYATVINGIMQIETLKANGNEDDFFERWAGYHTKYEKGMAEIQIYSLILQFMPLFTAGLNTALLMTLGGFDIMDGLMSTGIFLAFQNLMGNFQQPIGNLLNLGNSLQTTEMNLQRINDVMKYEEDELAFPKKTQPAIDKGHLWGDIELKDVTFGYNKLHEPLFDKFSMHLHPGDWIALVGGSGCGKSTLAKIIEGIYEEWSGEIRFDGILRREVPVDVLHNSLAVVAQDISLMRGTVEENITLFDKTIRHQDVVKAAMDACIYDDIMNLPKGFDSEVREGGANFSGGQRQRLELTRALATNPSIMILDEATSALDTVTEEKIINNIRHRGCTCILVAHRLSTIRDCDEIIVLDHGKVVERGKHHELMTLNGKYATLVKSKD
ncbi:MAG: NHLP family bacteriocin export ABC transporter peptidase/permease/ATPase subunit [Phascolarctobacterium sp.]|nr:NHLP family bacteriocin export ABC transporter peptidase/permease/ATPase subunit [Candidatus Phascolarctobacterium caballi]